MKLKDFKKLYKENVFYKDKNLTEQFNDDDFMDDQSISFSSPQNLKHHLVQ